MRTPDSLGETSLFTRIFLTNALVTAAAVVVLLLTPATVSSPAHLGEIAVVVGGLTAMLVINLFLLRRAFAPLDRLTTLMRRVELLRPGRRVPVFGTDAEIVELTRAFNEMLDRLEAERHESVRRSLAAQESERLRVARELHDEIGQSLTAILLHLERLVRTVPREMQPELAEVRETARASLEEVREIARRLRPEALDDLGLRSALGALSDRLAEQSGRSIKRRIERGLPQLEPEAELVIYRVAQEGLTNALRHSHASTIAISLAAADGEVVLDVNDDGRGLDGSPAGAGIQGMRERALIIGAELQIESAAGEGTRVRLEVPTAEGSR